MTSIWNSGCAILERMSEAAAVFFGKKSVMLEPIPGQAHWQTGPVEEAIRGLQATMTATALEHPDMGAHECLARAVAASNAREDVRGYSPLQHALGRAPGLDGRFYTPEYEALPTVQAELVDETYGNNIKRMQDSEVNFLRWTYQNRVSRASNSKNRKAQIFLPGTYVYYWCKDKRETKGSFKGIARILCTETRRDNEQVGSTGQLPLLPGAPRPGGCVWLGRAGRLMRADPTQLRLASRREEAYQELHDSQPIPWTARGELQKLQKGQYLDTSTEDDEDPWRNTPWDVQTDSVDIQAQEQQHSRKRLLIKTRAGNSQSSNTMFASSHTEILSDTETDWSSDDTALEIQFEMKTGKHAFQKTCRDLYAFVTSAAEKGRKGVFERQMSLEEEKV